MPPSSVIFLCLALCNVVELKPVLDVEYVQASVLPLSSEVMNRVLNTNGNQVIVQGFLATPDNTKNTVRRRLNDDDISVQTIFYDGNTQPKKVNEVRNNDFTFSIPPADNDVVIHTITYKDNRNNVPQVQDNQIFTLGGIGKDNSGIDRQDVKSSYDVPLHSVEALPPPVHKNVVQNVPQEDPFIDVRFGGGDDEPLKNPLVPSKLYTVLSL